MTRRKSKRMDGDGLSLLLALELGPEARSPQSVRDTSRDSRVKAAARAAAA